MTYIEALNLIRSVGFFGDFSEHSSKMFYLNKNDTIIFQGKPNDGLYVKRIRLKFTCILQYPTKLSVNYHKTDYIIQILHFLSDNLCRYSAYNTITGYILCHNRICADRHIISYNNA